MRIGWKKIVALGIVIVLVVIAYVAVSNLGFKIKAVRPPLDSVGALTPYIDFSFNKTLDSETTKVESSPAWVITQQDVQTNKIRVFLQRPLIVGSTYKLSLSAKAAGGDKMIRRTYSFTVKDIPFEKLPKEQQEYLTTGQNQGAFKDPILADLPHATPEYKLSGSLDNSQRPAKLKLQATLYLTQADMSNQDAAEAQYKQNVQEYISSLGLNPDDYQIIYVDSLP
jgi:hypothetical protein